MAEQPPAFQESIACVGSRHVLQTTPLLILAYEKLHLDALTEIGTGAEGLPQRQAVPAQNRPALNRQVKLLLLARLSHGPHFPALSCLGTG